MILLSFLLPHFPLCALMLNLDISLGVNIPLPNVCHYPISFLSSHLPPPLFFMSPFLCHFFSSLLSSSK
uniref:Secreted protein n=1 Tax=Octopus bimaculoides TaxID=37653 RepID=A0A0L8FYE4_OCTBM